MKTERDRLTPYILRDYDFAAFAHGTRVVDIGCGDGFQLKKLMARGCNAVGVDNDPERIRKCQDLGLPVIKGEAERLPFPSATFDGVICKVVIPLTMEPLAFREIARILKPGGTAQLCYMGAGFYLRLLMLGFPAQLKLRMYGLRTLINTWLFALTDLVLPGFLGDTLYQSRARLRKYYSDNRLNLIQDTPAKTFLGLPVFMYHLVQAAPANMSLQPVAESEDTQRESALIAEVA